MNIEGVGDHVKIFSVEFPKKRNNVRHLPQSSSSNVSLTGDALHFPIQRYDRPIRDAHALDTRPFQNSSILVYSSSSSRSTRSSNHPASCMARTPGRACTQTPLATGNPVHVGEQKSSIGFPFTVTPFTFQSSDELTIVTGR